MGKPRRPRSPRPALAPNQPFGDSQTETALPPEAVGAPEIALPPEPPVEAEPAPAFEAALEAVTEGPAHDAPADTVLHVEAAEPAPTVDLAPQEPAIQHDATADEPVPHEAAQDVPPETIADEPTVEESPIHDPEIQEPGIQEPVVGEPVIREAAETPVAEQPVFVEAAAEPEPVAPHVAPALSGAVAAAAPFASKAEFQFVFVPEPPDFSGIYAAIARYMRGESAAAAAHMRALGEARSPADLIRLQVGEFQRAADASLTCWSTVAHKAGYGFTYR